MHKVGSPSTNTYNELIIEFISSVIHLIDQRILNPLYFSDVIYKLSPAYQEEKKSLKVIHSFVDNVIETRRNEIIQKQQNGTKSSVESDSITTKKRNALMDLLLQSNMDGQPLSNDDIRGEVNTFMFAGHDTTTGASQFFFYLMAKNPVEQEKVYQEIKSLVIDSNEPLTIRLLNSLPYLDMCIKESLRLFPPVGGVGKCSEEDLVLGNVRIPAGDVLLVLFHTNHRNEKYFTNPLKFNPERFSEEVTTSDRNPYVYTPFSFGLRNCIGKMSE